MTNYELIRNKVIEAVPEILIEVDSEYPDEVSGVSYPVQIPGREIRLSDVLRAIESFAIMKVQEMEDSQMRLINKWSLTHDSLEWHRDNRPETVDFLAEILK